VHNDIAVGNLASNVSLMADKIGPLAPNISNLRLSRDEVFNAVSPVIDDQKLFLGIILGEEHADSCRHE
jgi:hypothetical protein